MRSHLIGHLGLSLLALGVIPLPSREPAEVDLKAADRALDALSAAGISALELLEFAGGPERFAALASICIANKAMLAEHGYPDVVDVARLLGRTVPLELQRLPSGRLVPADWRQREREPGRVIVRTSEPQPCCQAWRGNSSSPCSCPACVAKLEAQAADNARRAEVRRAREASRIQQAAARKISAGKKAKRGWR